MLVLALAAGASCSPRDPPNLDSPGTAIVCLGDSLTAGVGRGRSPSYPELLGASLGVEVVDAGVPGDTASDGLARLDATLAHDPWLVIVELGGNDLLRQIPVERTEAALRAIAERVLDARALPMLVEVRGPFGRRYSGLFDRIADDYGVPVVRDVLPDLLGDRRYKSDPVHLNGAGYNVLAEAIAERVRPLLERRRELGLAATPPAR